MRRKKTVNGEMEQKIAKLVRQAVDLELGFWEETAGRTPVKVPALPEKVLRRLRGRRIRQMARACAAVAAVLAVLLFVGNYQSFASGVHWVQEKIQKLFTLREEPLLPDTEHIEEREELETEAGGSEAPDSEAPELESGETESVGTVREYFNYPAEDYDYVAGDTCLWLPGIGSVWLAHHKDWDGQTLVMCKENQILYHIRTEQAWEYESRYHRIYCFMEDYNGDEYQDLLITEICSDADSRSYFTGELLLGQGDKGFASAGTFSYETGLVLGYQPASLASGYETDGLSVSWSGQRISLIYTDMDSVEPGQTEAFYAWSEDGGVTWQRTALVGREIHRDWGTVGSGWPVWHRDFAGGETVAVFDGDVLSVVRWAKDALAQETLDLSAAGQQTVVDHMTDNGSKSLSEVFFPDEMHGYLALDVKAGLGEDPWPILMETVDGGSTWEMVDPGLEHMELSSPEETVLGGTIYQIRMERGKLTADVLVVKEAQSSSSVQSYSQEIITIPVPQ